MSISFTDTGGEFHRWQVCLQPSFDACHLSRSWNYEPRVQYNWQGCFTSVFACMEFYFSSSCLFLTIALDFHNETGASRMFLPCEVKRWLNTRCFSVNIHTHLWGSVLFLYFLATFYPTYVESHVNTTWKDVTVIAIFLASGMICLAASAFYHTSGCHSKEVRYPHVASFCVKLTFLCIFIRLPHIVMPMTTPGLLFSL